MMKFSNKWYDALKYIDLIILPALLTFYGIIGTTLNIPNTEATMIIGNGAIVCLGTCLGISNHNYKKEN